MTAYAAAAARTTKEQPKNIKNNAKTIAA